MSSPVPPIIAVTGLKREARIVARPGIAAVAGGGDSKMLEERIRAVLATGPHRILSFGICGALSPLLRVGDCVVASEVVAGGRRFVTDAEWTSELLAQLPHAQRGIVLGSDSILADRAEKARLHRTTGAAAVDMESHVAARIAQEMCLPFATVRIVSDSHDHSLPRAAIVALSPSGKIDPGPVLRSILAEPTQIPALLRTAWDAEKAFRILARCRI